jgi:hypothetical protein
LGHVVTQHPVSDLSRQVMRLAQLWKVKNNCRPGKRRGLLKIKHYNALHEPQSLLHLVTMNRHQVIRRMVSHLKSHVSKSSHEHGQGLWYFLVYMSRSLSIHSCTSRGHLQTNIWHTHKHTHRQTDTHIRTHACTHTYTHAHKQHPHTQTQHKHTHTHLFHQHLLPSCTLSW